VFSAGADGVTPLGITATRHVITASGQTLGVFGADYELSSIAKSLEATVKGVESTFTMFIVEDSTQALIAASVPGVAVDGTNRVLAVDCLDTVIRVSSEVLTAAGGFGATDRVLKLVNVPGKGLYWAQSSELVDAYGLHWHIVVCEAVLCEVGFFANVQADDVDAVCERCPRGATCRGGRWLPYPQPGFWADMTTEAALTLDMEACRDPHNCPGGEARPTASRCFEGQGNFTDCVAALAAEAGGEDYGSSFLCKEGAGGRLCDVCEQSYFMSADTGCESCGSGGSVTGTVVAFFLLVVILAGLAAVYYKGEEFLGFNLRDNAYWRAVADPARFKIVWATAQIVSSVTFTTNVSWPNPFKTMTKILGFVQLSFADVLPTSCFSPVNYYQQLLVATLVPVGVLVALQVVSHPFFTKDTDDRWGLLMDRGWGIYLAQLVAFCVLPSTSLVIFRVFQCHEFNDGASFLTADMSISCDTAEYDSYVGYAIFCILIFPVGIPLSFFAVLHAHKDAIMARDPLAAVPKKLEKYEFLFVDYSTDMWHGEVVRSVMRVVLSAAVVTFSSSAVSRASWGSVIAFGFLVAMREYQVSDALC
jgi:hypothetical protein